ncbi:MAG: sulfatase-like hydrolase/transferase [Spirochaetes bacterium]|nr:sulfatase-like hydrolase/transferase [Spirochaetota bacterium]
MNSQMKRNILVILCDQLRKDFLSCYGCKAIPTPALDSLAACGVVFDNALTVSPVCAPARASMMTGRYVSDHGVWTNDLPFREGLEYLPERMNALGYATGCFGKLHHYPANDAKGFQHVRLTEENRLGEEDGYLRWLRARRPGVTNVFNGKGYEYSLPAEEHYEHWVVDEALTFMKAGRGSAPFFAWVSFQGPHDPVHPPKAFKGSVDGALLPQPISACPDEGEVIRYRRACAGVTKDRAALMEKRVAYGDFIHYIDTQIGRILDGLKEEGLWESTTVLFSADHGDLLGDHGLMQKGPYPYRGQLDVPLILANQPGVEAGRSAALTGNLDLPATVLDCAGDAHPLGVSRSLIPMARGEEVSLRRVNYSEFCDSIKTVEDGRWRFSYFPFTGKRMLFDKRADTDELVNLSGRGELAGLEAGFLAAVLDHLIVAKGVRVEAHDLVPAQQEGLSRLAPGWREGFEVAFPLSALERERLRGEGLDTEYLDFCRAKPVLRCYAKPYWKTGL